MKTKSNNSTLWITILLLGGTLLAASVLSAGEAVQALHNAGKDFSGEVREISTITPLSLFEQLVITTAAFVLKPVYQIIALIIIFMLWNREDTELAAIRRAMLAFVIGENACALNYLFFQECSLFMESTHIGGMLVCFGFFVYAFMTAFDKRIMHFSERDKKCALLSTCPQCYKYSPYRCNAWLLFLCIIPATMLLAGIPLSALIGSHFYEGIVFCNPVLFGHQVRYQFVEVRVCPLLSLLLLGASFLVLLQRGEDGFAPAKVLFAAGTGALGFSLMRFFLYWGYKENSLWADAWEEITEFIFVTIIFKIVLMVRTAPSRFNFGLRRKRPRLTNNLPICWLI